MIVRPKSEDPWNDNEEAISAYLGLLFVEKYGHYQDRLTDAAEQGVDALESELKLVASAVPVVMSTAYPTKVYTELSGAAEAGQELYGASMNDPRIDSMNGALEVGTAAAMNVYFEEQVIPKLLQVVGDAVASGIAGEALRDVFTKAFGEIISSDNPYWNIQANQVTVRAHNYGILRSARTRGMSGYRLVAVMDERTTTFCRSVDGKEFWVADGLAEYERVGFGSPAYMRTESPWVDTSIDASRTSSSQLAASRKLVPPFHARCRTTIQPIY